MGYFSDVALALDKDKAETMRREAEANPDDYVASFVEGSDVHLVDPDTGAECLVWKEVKWYADPPEIDAHPEVRFLRDFLDDADPAGFYFVRTGEDADEVEIDGSFRNNPFRLGVSVSQISYEDPRSETNPFEALFEKISAETGQEKAMELLEQCLDKAREKDGPSPSC